MARKRTLIVGGGVARSSAAQAIYQTADNVEVIVADVEDRTPYNRTTVNKGLLSGAGERGGHRPARHRIAPGAAVGQGRTAAEVMLYDLMKGRPGAQAPDPAPQPLGAGYNTYVHGTKLTTVGNPSVGVREQVIFGDSTDAARFAFAFFSAEDRIAGAVGVGGARAINRLRSAAKRRSPYTELELENRHESAGRAQ